MCACACVYMRVCECFCFLLCACVQFVCMRACVALRACIDDWVSGGRVSCVCVCACVCNSRDPLQTMTTIMAASALSCPPYNKRVLIVDADSQCNTTRYS